MDPNDALDSNSNSSDDGSSSDGSDVDEDRIVSLRTLEHVPQMK